eukprot:1156422-Pelagomonas_calceolata.AAC.1
MQVGSAEFGVGMGWQSRQHAVGLVSRPSRHRWGGRWKFPNIWMTGNCVGYQKECHGGQSSSSVGDEYFSPRERPFSLGWRVSNFGRHCEFLRARSLINSDAKLAGGGPILLCKPSALALWNAL